MKKLVYLIILALILGLVLTGCLLSNVGQVPATEQSGITYLTKGTEIAPDVFTLYAGQTIPVGTVSVWNDNEELHVTYNTTGGWVLAETHLAVVTDPAFFPMTKTSNPKVGKFLYGAEDLIEFDLDGNIIGPYIYDETILLSKLGVTHKNILYIAAHAVVMNIDDMMEEVVVSRPGIDVYGPLSEYAVLQDSSWGTANFAVPTFVSSWPLIPGATWISTDYYTEDPVNNSWRWFHDKIDLPEKGYYIAGSVVLATADDTGEVYFNGESAGSNLVLGVLTEYSIEPQPGPNTLDFIVMNSAQTDVNPPTPTSNPNGLIYKATVTYYPEESAWAAYGEEPGEIPFPGNNWATYFTYFEPIYIESVEVFPYGADHCSSKILETGKKYCLDASGTYRFANWGDAGIADAKYSLRSSIAGSPWTSGDALPSPWENFLEIWVDGASQTWGDFNPAHTYSTEYTGDGTSVCFSIVDSAYGDNSGSLTVKIYLIP